MLITPLEILHSGDLYVKIILNGKYLAKVLEVFLSFSSSFFPRLFIPTMTAGTDAAVFISTTFHFIHLKLT